MFDHTAAEPTDEPMTMGLRYTALYCTAFLAERVLTSTGVLAPVATFIRERHTPDPTGKAAWAPGNPAPPETPATAPQTGQS